MRRLEELLKDSDHNRGEFKLGRFPMRGNVPLHYKRLNISEDKADELAHLGAKELFSAFGYKPYYTQAVLAGAMFSEEYDTVVAVTPSQYGKSILLGHCAALMAYKGNKLSVAAANTDTTNIIMAYTRQSIREATPDIKDAIMGETMKKIDRLDSSLSKGRISYARGGYIESITLGDTFGDLSHNKAVGRGSAS